MGLCVRRNDARRGAQVQFDFQTAHFTFTCDRDLAAHPREFCQQVSPQKREGAGNAGRLVRPQPRVVGRKHAR
jgi:hypothetical protein